MAKQLLKSACFTDIHFGRKNNSEMHNQDCLNYIEWFCEKVKEDEGVDHIIFLGDWYEHRSAIDGRTLKYSYEGAKMINALGLPIFVIVGNHDLYYRNNREIWTTNVFDSLDNITVVSEPTVFKEIGKRGSLICPYLFHNEYPKLLEYMDVPTWFGHFEFKGFILTGETVVAKSGPNAGDYRSINKIFTGHYHKRQRTDNVQYIGNAFPADFSDANDNERGCMMYSHIDDTVEFQDWGDCPKYITVDLSDMVKNSDTILSDNARVKCNVDYIITFDDSNEIRKKYLEEYNLRELRLVESNELEILLEETDADLDLEKMSKMSTDEVIIELLSHVGEGKIKSEKLVKIYRSLG